MLKAVIFDLYDTLIYLDMDKYRSYRLELARLLQTTPEMLEKVWRSYRKKRCTGKIDSLQEMMGILVKNFEIPADRVDMQRLEELERDGLYESVQIYPGVDEMLQALKDDGYIPALLSNASYNNRNVTRKLPFLSKFDYKVFSNEVGMVKPDPDIYQLMLDKMGIGAEECVFIGDGGSNELDGARKVGLTTVKACFPGQDKREEKNRSGNYDYRVEDIGEIQAVVNRIKREKQENNRNDF